MTKLIVLASLLTSVFASGCALDADPTGEDVAALQVSGADDGTASTAGSKDVACPPAPVPTEDGTNGVEHTDPLDGAMATDATGRAQASGAIAKPPSAELRDDFCAHLPAEGACSLACDPEKLIELYVPKGTCAVFGCTPVDGGEPFVTGGCND